MAIFRHMPDVEARAALISLGVGIGLLGLKFAAYAITGSAAVFSDAVESIANVLASSVALYCLYVAHSPADKAHPYGHGKIEFLSAGFEGGMILLAGILIIIRTIDGLVHGVQLERTRLDLGLALVALAMAVNGYVGLYLIGLGRRSGSMTLLADGRHLLSDALTSVAALGALAVVRFTGWVWVDPATAIGVGCYVGLMGMRLLKGAGAGLMDRQDAADEQLLQKILDAHVGPDGNEPRICGYCNLRHRHSGRYHWVDFHVFVPSHFTVDQGHQIATAIEQEIELAVGQGNATAHVEPCHDRPCILGPDGPVENPRKAGQS